MTSQAAREDTLVGKTLAHYRIVEKIGEGGVGVVYRAQDQHLAREVAIKLLRLGALGDEHSRKCFRKEALVLSKLNHPNIATIYDFDTQQDVDFLVMEYIPGMALGEKLAQRPLPEKEIIGLGTQLADGLSAAHEHGIVHRDLKPGNLRLTSEGRLKILDFGLAKLRLPVTANATTESLSEAQNMAGTLPYMAPEQLLGGEIDVRTDIHATGTVLYEMATGQRPFTTVERSQLVGAILRHPPLPAIVLNPKLSPRMEQIIEKCLEKDPENRYQSAKELTIDLRRLGSMSTAAEPVHQKKRRGRNAILFVVALLAILGAALFTLNIGRWRDRAWGNATATHIGALAVLPLANLSGDPAQEYFADGMTDELITHLSQISALRVISRTSVMRYKGAPQPLARIARELNVDALVEGSVLRSGDRVRITAQLIDPESARNIWSDEYERDMKDVLALQSDVAHAIAREIKVKVNPMEQSRLGYSREVDPDAYQMYLKGRFYWNKRTEESMKKALDYFQQAISKDPNYAMAYAGVADSYAVLVAYGLISPNEAYNFEEQAARKAVQLGPTLAETHASVASIETDNHDWTDGLAEFERAIELNPNYATAHQWYAETLMKLGRPEEALREIQRAQELDPFSLIINSEHGYLLYLAREYDRAIVQCQNTLEMDPNFYRAYLYLAYAYEQKKMYAEAIAQLNKGMSVRGGNTTEMLAALAHVYAMAGQKTNALQLLATLEQQLKRKYLDPYQVAVVYAALGKTTEALIWLEKAYRDRSEALTFTRPDPRADPLRSDPRYQDVLRRMNLPQ